MGYQAIIARLENVVKHPNADRLQIATCRSFNVVVGLEAKDGDMVVLFPEDGQLSEEFATANNLVRKKDENGNNIGGMFDENRRVRTQTLRGVKSEAFVIGLNSLEKLNLDISKLKEGDAFSVLENTLICEKYINPNTRKKANNQSNNKAKNKNKWNKMVNQFLKDSFHEHKETDNIRFLNSQVASNSIMTVTLKLHGTSQRSTYLNVIEEPKTIFQKIKVFFTKKLERNWKKIYGTRRVIKTQESNDYRKKCHDIVSARMRKGETWYYEIVGYEDTGALIMHSCDNKKMKDKDFINKYGNQTNFTYGMDEKQCDIYVYRITLQDEDGNLVEMPWPLVKQRCNESGIKHVPEIYTVMVGDQCDPSQIVEDVTKYVEESEDFNNLGDWSSLHINEGVCVRFDSLENGNSKIFKCKSFKFRILEGIVKESGVVDTEEVESITTENSYIL